jgi:hypothetical protein
MVGTQMLFGWLAQAHGLAPNPYKTGMHKRMDREPDLWTKRPLEKAVLDYAGRGLHLWSHTARLSLHCMQPLVPLHGHHAFQLPGLPAGPNQPSLQCMWNIICTFHGPTCCIPSCGAVADVDRLLALRAAMVAELGNSGDAAVLHLSKAYAGSQLSSIMLLWPALRSPAQAQWEHSWALSVHA